MATSGTKAAAANVLSLPIVYPTSITLIGDSENVTAANNDGVTDIANRSTIELDKRTQFNYNKRSHADVTVSTSSLVPLQTLLDNLQYTTLDHDLTITLHANLTLSEKLEITRISGAGSLTINLNSKQLTPGSVMVDDKAIHIHNNSLAKITIHSGIIDDTTGDKLSNIIWASDCSGLVFFNALDTIFLNGSGTAGNHYLIDNVQSCYLSGCDISYGTNGLYATDNSRVLTSSNSTTANPTGYGNVAVLNATIGQSGGGQFTGATGTNSATAPGVIR